MEKQLKPIQCTMHCTYQLSMKINDYHINMLNTEERRVIQIQNTYRYLYPC